MSGLVHASETQWQHYESIYLDQQILGITLMLVRTVDILHHHTMRGVKNIISFYFLYMGIGGVGWWVNFFFFNYVICERQWERSDELQETLLISQMDLYLLQIHIS